VPQIEPLNAKQQILAEEALQRADKIAQRYSRIFPEHVDDIKSSASYGAIRAASSFEPDKGGVWDRWLAVCVKGEIQSCLDRPDIQRSQTLTLYALKDAAMSNDSFELVDIADSLDRLLKALPGNRRTLCELIYKCGLTITEAARSLGISRDNANRIHQSAMHTLRLHLAV
jgi:RNA polymerase sigma factor (sigma-70 family)